MFVVCNRFGTEQPVNACEQKICSDIHVFTPLSRNTPVSAHPQGGSNNIIITFTKKGASCTHLRNRKRVPIPGHYRLVALRM